MASNRDAYVRDRAYSDGFTPAIIRALAPHLIVPASKELDTKEATDFLVFKACDLRIAARIRTPEWFDKCPDEFTIRSCRPTGTRTEFAKIMGEWGDLFFYGFGDPDGKTLAAWRLMSLQEFRLAVGRAGYKGDGRRIWTEIENPDGTKFAAFRVADFPPALVVAEFGHRPVYRPPPVAPLTAPAPKPQLGLFPGRRGGWK